MNNELANVVRSKCDIVDVIGERIPLVARGKNFFGVCPFHDDSNPSLCVSREKQIYTCFSCHATGNVYTFLMNYEHMDFREALRYLGEKVGVDVSGVSIKRKSSKYDSYYDAYQFASKYFQNNLLSKIGADARSYLASRKLDDRVIKEFEIGLSLDNHQDLTKLLTSKKYSLGDLNQMGLSSDDRDTYIDRIMFPLYDLNGRVVGFSGRIYRDNGLNKYLNTKETPIFKKGQLLYHYHIAREECRIKKSVIVMEGFMDVIRASTIGVRNTVALMGTALTHEQLQLLKRLSPNIILCLDGDDPGVHATLTIGDMLLSEGIEAKVLSLPNPDDPDTYILNQGKEKFLGLLDNAVTFSDYKLRKLKESVDFRSEEETAKYINKVLEETSKVADPIRVEIILKKLAKEFDLSYNTLEYRFKELAKPKEKIDVKKEVVIYKAKKKTKYEKAMEEILYLMLNCDWVISLFEKERFIFPNEKSRLLASEIVYYYTKNGSINIPDFYTYVQDKDEVVEYLNDILACNYRDQITRDELFLLFGVIREYSRTQEIKRLTNSLKKEVDPLEQAKIADKIRELRIGDK
jgi:DNA primase